MQNKIENLLQAYTPISLKEMDTVGFMNRTDTKFYFNSDLIPKILEKCSSYYFVLEIDLKRSFHYTTTYFDTPAFDLYHNHINGHLNRFKIRQRKYEATGAEFFEIKFKTNKSRTIKSRIQNNQTQILNAHSDLFLQKKTPLRIEQIQSALTNYFNRITLVSKEMNARVTLDFNLKFSDNTQMIELPAIGIAEIKQEGTSAKPFIAALLKELGHRPESFSKYCIGAALLHKHLKTNSLKPKLTHINKLHHDQLIAR